MLTVWHLLSSLTLSSVTLLPLDRLLRTQCGYYTWTITDDMQHISSSLPRSCGIAQCTVIFKVQFLSLKDPSPLLCYPESQNISVTGRTSHISCDLLQRQGELDGERASIWACLEGVLIREGPHRSSKKIGQRKSWGGMEGDGEQEAESPGRWRGEGEVRVVGGGFTFHRGGMGKAPVCVGRSSSPFCWKGFRETKL